MFKSIYAFRLNGTLTNAAAPNTVDISNVIGWNEVASFTDSTIVAQNDEGTIWEIMQATASGWVLTISQRGLDPTDIKTEVSANRKEWRAGTFVYVAASASDLVDIDGENEITGVFDFTSTTVAQLLTQQLTTVQRDALTGVVDGALIYNTTDWAFQGREGGSWTGFWPWAATPNATPTTVGKVKVATTTEFNNGTDITGGAYNVVIPSQIQGFGVNYTDLAWVSKGGNDSTAVVGNPNKPYLTIAAAQAAAGSGSGAIQWVVYVTRGTYTENISLEEWQVLYCDPWVVIDGNVSAPVWWGGVNYFMKWYADIQGDVSCANDTNTLSLECQSITNDEIDDIRGIVDILVRWDITITAGSFEGIIIWDWNACEWVIRVLWDINITRNSGSSNIGILIESTSSNVLEIYANNISLTGAAAPTIQFDDGVVRIYAKSIGWSSQFAVRAGTITGWSSLEVRDARLTGSTAAIRIDDVASSDAVIAWNTVLLGTNAVSSAVASNIRLYNCLSTNAVDGNTTNVITWGLVTDAQVT